MVLGTIFSNKSNSGITDRKPMKNILALLVLLMTFPALAQSTSQQTTPGVLTASGCPSGQHVCFKQYSSTNPLPVSVSIGTSGIACPSCANGQLLIGNASTSSFGINTLTAGSGITVTNGPGTITLSASGGGGTVTSVTFTGDGTLLSSTPSSAVTTSGTVAATLLNASAKSLFGNTSSSSGTPSYVTSPVVSGSMTAASHIPTGSSIPTDGLYLPAANTTGLADNSQPVVETVGVASAVDYLTVTNAATANPANLAIAAAGTDTNINLSLTPKGTGNIGIGTTAPLSKLSIAGNLALGSYGGGASTVAAPSNGLIVSGSVGIGSNSPTQPLEVVGQILATQIVGARGASSTASFSANGGWAQLNVGSTLNIHDNNPSQANFIASGNGLMLGNSTLAKSTVDIYGQIAIGTSYAGAIPAAPSNGAIIQGAVGIGTNAPTAGASLDLKYNTNSMLLPVGTTTQRPTGINGMLRYNSTSNVLEGFINGVWSALSSGSTGTPTCGTGCSSITSGSTDSRGSMTVTALATSAVVNFSATLPSAPFCGCSGSLSTSVASCTNTTSAITANLSVGVTGDVITWQCPQ